MKIHPIVIFNLILLISSACKYDELSEKAFSSCTGRTLNNIAREGKVNKSYADNFVTPDCADANLKGFKIIYMVDKKGPGNNFLLILYRGENDYLFATNAKSENIRLLFSDKIKGEKLNPESLNFAPTSSWEDYPMNVGNYTMFPDGANRPKKPRLSF